MGNQGSPLLSHFISRIIIRRGTSLVMNNLQSPCTAKAVSLAAMSLSLMSLHSRRHWANIVANPTLGKGSPTHTLHADTCQTPLPFISWNINPVSWPAMDIGYSTATPHISQVHFVSQGIITDPTFHSWVFRLLGGFVPCIAFACRRCPLC